MWQICVFQTIDKERKERRPSVRQREPSQVIANGKTHEESANNKDKVWLAVEKLI